MKKINFLIACTCIFSSSLFAQSKTTSLIHSNQSVELETVYTIQGSLISAIMDSANGFASFKIFRSVDQGASWSQVFDGGSATANIEGDPVLTADTNGNLYISYIDIFAPQYDNSVVRIIKSVDDGITWNTVSSIQNAGLGGPKRVFEVPDMIVTKDGILHITYTFGIADASGSVGPGRIFHQYSSDGGLSWSSPVLVIDSILVPFGSRINLGYNGSVIISSVNTVGTKAYYCSSSDNGVTWPAPKILNIPLVAKDPGNQLCKVVSNLNHPNLMMIMHPAHELTHTFMTFSKDSGLTWSPISLLDTLAGYGEGILDENGLFHLSWLAHSGGQVQLKYMNFNDPANIPTAQIIESSPINQNPNDRTYIGEYQTILTDPSSNIHITWIDFGDGLKAKHTRLSNVVNIMEINLTKKDIVIYPNPVEDKIRLEIHFAENKVGYSYKIYTMEGSVHSKGIFSLENDNSVTINTLPLAKGNYILEISLDGSMTNSAKFTKK